MEYKRLFSVSKKTLNILFAILLVLLLAVEVDWHFVLKEWHHLDWRWLGVYLALQPVIILFSVKKWQAIARAYDISFSVGAGFLVYLKGMFLNNFLPTTIGGDTYRCYWLGEHTGKRAASYASVVLDRLFGLFVTMCLGLGSVLFILPLIEANRFFAFVYLGLAVLVMVAFMVGGHLLLGWRIFSFGKITFLDKPFFAFLTKKRSWQDYQEILFWSGAFSAVGLVVSNYILFLAFGIPLPPLPFITIMLLVILFSNLPVSINNIGIKEWSYATFFVYLGVPLEAAVAVAILSRIFQMGVSLLAVPISLSLEGGIFFPTKRTIQQAKLVEESLEEV